ncbi:MAG: hypothetical protein LZF61_02775 [Nitrosomonas sp.]|nr:MAG: hypothetical protein LZF61_02775 [Nitrosomonas sp.]
MRTKQMIIATNTIAVLLLLSAGIAFAGPDVSEIQKRFNAETVNRPFSVPSDAELTKSLDEATKRGQPTYQSRSNFGGCVGPACAWGRNYGYGSYFGGYARPHYGGFYGVNSFLPYYYGW